jgi:hypothetical protein
MKIKRLITPGILLIFLSISSTALPVFGNQSDKDEAVKNDKRVEGRKKNFNLALGEALILETGATLIYWHKYARFIEDWQFELTLEDQIRRFLTLDALRFDSNNFQLNYTHSLAGALFYSFARTNRFTPFESFLFTATHSLFWEYITEWREVVSINDNIFTIMGGAIIGESFFQLGNYFLGKKGIINRALGIFFNPVLHINCLLDKNNHPQSYPYKDSLSLNLGFVKDYSISSLREPQFYLGLHVRILNLDKFKEVSDFSIRVKGVPLNDLSMKMRIGNAGIEEFQTRLRVVYKGLFSQVIQIDEGDLLTGYSMLLGWGSGYEFLRRRSLEDYDGANEFVFVKDDPIIDYPVQFTEKRAVINLIGPSLDLIVFRKQLTLSITTAFYPDFAMINSFALREFSKTVHLGYTKSNLSNFGYYFALGCSFLFNFDLDYRNVHLGIRFNWQYYDSVEGVDRMQDKIRYDYDLTDTRREFNLELGVNLRFIPVSLKLVWENLFFKGWIEGTKDSRIEERLYLQTGIQF